METPLGGIEVQKGKGDSDQDSSAGVWHGWARSFEGQSGATSIVDVENLARLVMHEQAGNAA